MTGSLRVVLLVCACAAVARAQGRVTAELDRASAFLGDPVSFVVTVQEVEATGEPALEGFEAFTVSGPSVEQRRSIVGGRVYARQSFVYSLRALRAGTLTVPAVSVPTAAGVLRTEPLALEVLAPESSDTAVLVLDADPAGIYPLQEFTLRLRVFVRALPAGFGNLDPIAHVRPPLLQIDWLEAPDGLEGASMQEWLGARVTSGRGGFAINELTVNSGGGFFFEDRQRAVFDLGPRRATTADLDGVAAPPGGTGDWWVYTLERRLRATRTGSYTFTPVLLKGRLPGAGAGGRLVERDVFTASNALTVEVRPVPEQGRPASWSGAIGRFRVDAEVTPREARVGDPLTLTLRVRGEGNLDEIGPPPLGALEDGFRVHEASAATTDGERRFTWSVRPAGTGVTAVPPIEFSWFDLQEARYQVARTEPIPIRVGEAPRLDPGEIATAGPRDDPGVEATGGGLLANVTDPAQVRDEAVDARVVLGYAGFLVLLYAGFSVALARWRRLHGDPRARRRRGAAARARARVGTEESLAVFAGLVADVAGLPEAGLTAREVVAHLRRLGVDEESGARIAEHLARVEHARYAGGGGGDGARAGALLEETIVALQAQGRLS